MNVEHGTFTPLVFSVTVGECTETSTFHRHLASKIALKKDERYEDNVNFIRCKLSFLIMRSALTCIRGGRPYDKASVVVDDFTLTCDSAGIWWVGKTLHTQTLFFICFFRSVSKYFIHRYIVCIVVEKKKTKKKQKTNINSSYNVKNNFYEIFTTC